ncbi:hypothetical protein FDF31_00680 [Clostridium sporogenes]|uniref:ABC transporter permease n=1 Tax=unclassified Clostridium TaxID=2614128 RepID=UPI0013D18981|nr:hypothetical protein [Clostridium sporogenes]NFS24228.1 hypothetical protein [Clostridium sporogenes]
MIINILKNEITKMIHSKKNYILFIFLIFMIVSIIFIINSDKARIVNSQAISMDKNRARDILNMNSVLFLNYFSTEFIFRTVVPYFVFFMVAFSVDSFGEDFFGGTMKYCINLCENNTDIFIGKVLNLFVCAFFIVMSNILLGFIISSFAFKTTFYGLGRIIFIYLSSIIPVVSFSLIIGLISMFIQNKNISFALGIMISIFLTISDRLTITSKFSPIGVLGLMDKVRATNISFGLLVTSNIVSCVYLIIALFIGMNIFKNKEFNY